MAEDPLGRPAAGTRPRRLGAASSVAVALGCSLVFVLAAVVVSAGVWALVEIWGAILS